MTKIQKYQAEGSDQAIDSVVKQNITVLKYEPLSGSIYIKLAKELNHSIKSLINIQNINDDKYLKWCQFDS